MKLLDFPLTVSGFTYHGRVEEINESHSLLLDNFNAWIRCPECASMASMLSDEGLSCLCGKVMLDPVKPRAIERFRADWLVYTKNR